MITFNQNFYANLAQYVRNISSVHNRLNSADIVVNTLQPNAYNFDTHQFKIENPVETLFVEIRLQEGDDSQSIPFHLFEQLRTNFFDKFQEAIGKELYDILVVCPQIDATFSIKLEQLDDVVLGALILKYMSEYYLQLQEICLATSGIGLSAVLNLLKLSDEISKLEVPNFKTVYLSKDFLTDHSLNSALVHTRTPLL